MRTAVTPWVWKDTSVYFFGKSCRSADIRPDKCQNPQFKKSKIMKIHHFLKSHPECLWGQELVSRPSLTPNLPIFKRKNSSQKELIPYIISEILTFFDFYEIHVGCKSFHLWVNCRNFYPKISSLKSLERIDVFCTINRNFLIITMKLA